MQSRHLLLLCVIGTQIGAPLVCAEQLKGHLQQNDKQRVIRPAIPAQQPAMQSKFNLDVPKAQSLGLTTDMFHFSTLKTSTPSNSNPKQDVKEKKSSEKDIFQPVPSSIPNSTPSSKPDAEISRSEKSSASNHSRPPSRSKQKILIRLTHHTQDPQNTYMAFVFAKQMAKKGGDVSVTVFLDKESVNALNPHSLVSLGQKSDTQMKSIKTVMLEYLSDGGRIIASKSWATLIGPWHEGNSVAGVEFLNDEDVVREVVDADKIIEY